MAGFRDRYGHRLTTRSSAAAEQYVDGMDLLLGHRTGAGACFARATEEDDSFAMPYAVRAYVSWATGDSAAANAEIQKAAARTGGVSEQERGHVQLVAARISADRDLLARMRSHLSAFPTDRLVLRLAYFATVFGGSEQPERAAHELLRSAAAHYGGDGWFAGLFALSHEELGETGPARRLAEAALEADPGGSSGAHPLAHVLYATAAHRDGRAFLAPWLGAYDRGAPFRAHMAWHLALFELAEDDASAAYEVLRNELVPAPAQSYALVDDLASLLWRLRLVGHPGDDREWEQARSLAEPALARPGFSFRDAHATLAFAGAGDDELLGRMLAAQSELAERGHPVAGAVVAPIVEGLTAFTHGNFRAASELLARAYPSLSRLGGTRSQREVFEETLLVAFLEIGAGREAEELVAARLSLRPSHRDEALLRRLGRSV